MKQYAVRVKHIKLGGWYRPTAICKHVYKDKDEAIRDAERFLAYDRGLEYQHWERYKIIERDISEWKDS